MPMRHGHGACTSWYGFHPFHRYMYSCKPCPAHFDSKIQKIYLKILLNYLSLFIPIKPCPLFSPALPTIFVDSNSVNKCVLYPVLYVLYPGSRPVFFETFFAYSGTYQKKHHRNQTLLIIGSKCTFFVTTVPTLNESDVSLPSNVVSWPPNH
jgi:hypothetical protein